MIRWLRVWWWRAYTQWLTNNRRTRSRPPVPKHDHW